MIVPFDLSQFDPFDPDEPYQVLYREAIDAAQNGRFDNLPKQMRYFILYQMALAACRKHPDLDVAECGCLHGHSTFMIARLLQENGFRGQMHVFDSFEGLSVFTEADEGGLFETEEQKATIRRSFKSNRERVQELLAPFKFVKLYPGWIPERFNEVADRHFGFFSLDVDLYEPTLQSLQFFFPRLCENGTAFLDDYGYYRTFPGARKAVDEFLAGVLANQFIRMPFGSAVIVK
jgi:hypothetical protein